MVKYNIIITAQAKRSLQQIYDYIKEERSAQAAQKVRQGIRDAIAKLAKNPDSNGLAKDLNDETIILPTHTCMELQSCLQNRRG